MSRGLILGMGSTDVLGTVYNNSMAAEVQHIDHETNALAVF